MEAIKNQLNTIFEWGQPMTVPAKLGLNWQSSFREDFVILFFWGLNTNSFQHKQQNQ